MPFVLGWNVSPARHRYSDMEERMALGFLLFWTGFGAVALLG
jgi:hypothetical protein